MNEDIATYRAKVRCIAGGVLRREDDVFSMKRLKVTPEHLVLVCSGMKGEMAIDEPPIERRRPGRPPSGIPKRDQASSQDIVGREAIPVEDYTPGIK